MMKSRSANDEADLLFAVCNYGLITLTILLFTRALTKMIDTDLAFRTPTADLGIGIHFFYPPHG